MTQRGVIYVTKMKKNLKYKVLNDTMYQTSDGLMEVRIQYVALSKRLKEKEIVHHSRIVTYADEKKKKDIPLLTNDMASKLIANLLLIVMQKGLSRSWSFSGLATMVRITLKYYVDFYSLFNNPEKDRERCLKEASESPPELSLFD